MEKTKFDELLRNSKCWDFLSEYLIKPDILWDAMNDDEKKRFAKSRGAFRVRYRLMVGVVLLITGILVILICFLLDNCFFGT